jgi:hypothetical protein
MNPAPEYLKALRAKVQTLGSLDDLVNAVEAGAQERSVDVRVHSKGTWSRILSGQQTPAYRHLVEIALACDLPLPHRPPQEAARDVEHWHTLGEKTPRFGLLMDEPANVRVKPDREAPDLVVTVSRPKRRRRTPRATIHLAPEDRDRLATYKEATGMTWPDFVHHVVLDAVEQWSEEREDADGKALCLNCGPGP